MRLEHGQAVPSLSMETRAPWLSQAVKPIIGGMGQAPAIYRAGVSSLGDNFQRKPIFETVQIMRPKDFNLGVRQTLNILWGNYPL